MAQLIQAFGKGVQLSACRISNRLARSTGLAAFRTPQAALLERIGPTQTSMVTYLLPPFALIYGAIFLAERITLNTLAGLSLIIIGILLCNGVIRIAAAVRGASAS